MTIPSTKELAWLAAALGRSTATPADDLIKAALNLWKEADATVNRELRRLKAEAEEWESSQDYDPEEEEKDFMKYEAPRIWDLVNNSFPVDLDRLLEVAIPRLKGRTADLMARYRRYLRTKDPECNTDQVIAKQRHNFFTRDLYLQEYRAIQHWDLEDRIASTRAARSKAGKTGAHVKRQRAEAARKAQANNLSKATLKKSLHQ